MNILTIGNPNVKGFALRIAKMIEYQLLITITPDVYLKSVAWSYSTRVSH